MTTLLSHSMRNVIITTTTTTTTTKIARRIRACPKPSCRGKWCGNPGCRASTCVDLKPGEPIHLPCPWPAQPATSMNHVGSWSPEPTIDESSHAGERELRSLFLSLSLFFLLHFTITFDEREDSRFDETITKIQRRCTIMHSVQNSKMKSENLRLMNSSKIWKIFNDRVSKTSKWSCPIYFLSRLIALNRIPNWYLRIASYHFSLSICSRKLRQGNSLFATRYFGKLSEWDAIATSLPNLWKLAVILRETCLPHEA